jgi:hypothetical protein
MLKISRLSREGPWEGATREGLGRPFPKLANSAGFRLEQVYFSRRAEGPRAAPQSGDDMPREAGCQGQGRAKKRL